MNEDQGQDQPNPFPVNVPLLQDISHYIEENGIFPGHENITEENNGEIYQRQDQVEEEANISAQLQYQTKIINKFVQEDAELSNSTQKNERMKKESLIEKCSGLAISIQTSDDIIHNVPLPSLVDQCDTFLTLVGSHYWSSLLKQNSVFRLEEFAKDAVHEFLDLVKERSLRLESQKLPSTSAACDFSVGINSANIVECCYIAHFLQANGILKDIVSTIELSIDADNCTSICALADELQIPSLFQASMKFVMERLDQIQEEKELWDDMPKSLQNHIITLRNAAQSSIIGRGHSKEVIFSSGGEFLAIFHDTLTSHKERLQDAKQRQEEIIQERLRENASSSANGRFCRRFVQERDIYGGSVEDAAKKIKKQEDRIRTLQAFYNEQKSIFAEDMKSDCRFLGRFSL